MLRQAFGIGTVLPLAAAAAALVGAVSYLVMRRS